MSRDSARAIVRDDLELDGVAIQISPRSGQTLSFTSSKVPYDETSSVMPAAQPLRLSNDSARALYEALGRHFGGDATSNTRLRADYDAERSRVDRMINHLIGAPRV